MSRINFFSVMCLLLTSLFMYLISDVLLDIVIARGAENYYGLSMDFTLTKTLGFVQASLVIFCPIVSLLLIYSIVSLRREEREKEEDFLLKKEKAKNIKYFLFKMFLVSATVSFFAFHSFTTNISNGLKEFSIFSSSIMSYMNRFQFLMEEYKHFFQIHCYAAIIAVYLLTFALTFFVREKLFQKKVDKLLEASEQIQKIDVS